MSSTLAPPRRPVERRSPPRGDGAGSRHGNNRPARQLAPGDPRRRLRVAAVLATLVLVVMIARLVEMQTFSGPQMALKAERGRTVTLTLPALRGTISDADGVALATTVEARNVTADQTLVKDPRATAEVLAPLVGQSVNRLQRRLTGDRRFVYIAKGITPKKWQEIKALSLAGIFSEGTSRRVYPAGDVAANLVGFVGADGRGLGGLESSMQSTLAGTPGTLAYETSSGGERIPSGASKQVDAVDGRDVRLTIDRDIQWVAQQAIAAQVRATKAESGTVVVMDPRTGDVLAMATAPTFDPNRAGSAKAVNRGNRAVSDIYEPGSTSKVMTAAAVIEEGALTPGSRLSIPPTLPRAGSVFHDHEPHGTLHLTFAGVLAKSSNIGTILASEKIGSRTLYSYLKKFGIAEPSGLSFPGESRGLLPELKDWSGTTFPTVAFGQGLSVNALQATSVFATIANGGVRMQPRLVAATTQADGALEQTPPSAGVQVVSQKTARAVSDMLESVVSEEGTAPMAKIPGYRVAGKTGTANRVDPACGCYRGYTASFIGFAPADAPQLVVSVALQAPKRGHYGGRLGGPVFKKVMSFALQERAVAPTGTKPPRMRLSW